MNSQEFSQLFRLPWKNFSTAFPWTDKYVGFSTYEDHKMGFASLVKIGYDPQVSDIVKPLYITATYGKKIDDGLSLTSFQRKLTDPVDISSDEYSFNIETNQFFYNGKEVNPEEILREIDRSHNKPKKSFRGFFLRIRLWIRDHLRDLFKFLFEKTAATHYKRYGEKFSLYSADFKEPENHLKPVLPPFLEHSKPDGAVDILGYKVEAWVAILYAVIHLGLYFIFYYLDIKPSWIITMLKNNFLTVVYVISTLGLMNAVLSTVINISPHDTSIKFLRTFRDLYLRYLFKKIKI